MAVSFLQPLRIVFLAALYALVAKGSLALDAVEGFATLVWPPTGIALAATIRFGYGVWPGIALGALAANFWQGAPLPAALAIAAGNTIEAVLGAYLLRRSGFRSNLDRLSDVATFIGLGALCAPLASATIGPWVLTATGVIPVEHVAVTSIAWWMGDACGALIVGSLLLVWSSPRSRTTSSRALESVLLSFMFVVAAVVPMVGPAPSRSVGFLLFPLLIWATVRFGQRGATSVAAFVSGAAVAWTALGYGPFLVGRLQERLWTMQTYLIVMTITLLVLGAVTEERMHAVDALRGALTAREEFLSIASHELKTPLSAMVLTLSWLERALRRGEVLSSENVERKVERLVKQAGRLTALINQLLDVSRISSHSFELVQEDVELRDLVGEVCARFSEEAARANVTMSITGVDSLRGRWDRLRLEQVLSNLLSNGIRYGGPGPIEVSLERRGDHAVTIVRDQGRGIEPEALPSIFDRFSKSAASRRYGGLGLGLYISRQIVHAHGGVIRAASTVGKGSAFTVELPVSPPGFARRPKERDISTDRSRLAADRGTERDVHDSTHPDSR